MYLKTDATASTCEHDGADLNTKERPDRVEEPEPYEQDLSPTSTELSARLGPDVLTREDEEKFDVEHSGGPSDL